MTWPTAHSGTSQTWSPRWGENRPCWRAPCRCSSSRWRATRLAEVPVHQPERETGGRPAQVCQRRHGARPDQLQVDPQELQQDPKSDEGVRGDPEPPDGNQPQAEQYAHLCFRKLEGVEGNDAGDPAAGADEGDIRPRVQRDVGDVAEDGRDQDEPHVARLAEKILHVVAKDVQEIHVPRQVPKAAVQQERREEGEAEIPRVLGGDQAKLHHRRLDAGKRADAERADDSDDRPGQPGDAVEHRLLILDGQAQEGGQVFPQLTWRFGAEITLGTFGDRLRLRRGQDLRGPVRRRALSRGQHLRGDLLVLSRIEPDEAAHAAHVDRRAGRAAADLVHQVVAGGARTAAGDALLAGGVPDLIHRRLGDSPPQQFYANRASVAGRTEPVDALWAGAAVQWALIARAGEHGVPPAVRLHVQSDSCVGGCSRRRCTTTSSILTARSGFSFSKARKSHRTSCRQRVRSLAVTVAVRMRSSIRAISPKNSPGPISRILCPSCATSTRPSAMRKNPTPGSPCLTMAAPGS